MSESVRSYRAGYVTLVGAPNVGKSSLINALLREKVAAVSDKPQTTRNAVRCILTTDDYQIVIVDTPGIHKPKFALGEFMSGEIDAALESVDVVCFVAEAGQGLGEVGDEIYRRLEHIGTPLVLAVNKIDRLRDKEDFWRFLGPIQERIKPDAVVPVSALSGTNLDVLRDELASRLPEGGMIYPEDVLMDTTERFRAEEIIRERILDATEQEVPHSVAVVVEEFRSPDEYPELKRAEIRADIIVERPGQKGILIGAGGSKLKEIGSAARMEMERRFGYPVFLQLWVKVKPQWRKTQRDVERAGYRRG
ncbi:MAG: GTPase Era [Synergistaceae bacterium]|jgi:GTP-binding protein Era|nr:GTPase Era [Synergistaceae bacterium]